MAGLVSYASSDEDEEVPDALNDAQSIVRGAAGEREAKNIGADVTATIPKVANPIPPEAAEDSPSERFPGPSMPPEESHDEIGGAVPTAGSPYTSTRAAMRNLTMPPFPSFDIPPSPPGSPPQASTKKFTHFLELKKKGIHFNERLEKTTALKNPSLFQSLKERAVISDEEQYTTTLPEDIAVPTKFPPWAYADELYRSQMKIKTRREEEAKKKPRDAIDFVPALQSGTSSRASTPGGLRAGAKSNVKKTTGQHPVQNP